MAITVKDIQNKEFGRQMRGYNSDEVDEFLDELAEQMAALINENRSLIKQLDEAQSTPGTAAAPVEAAPAAAVTQPEPAVVEAPKYVPAAPSAENSGDNAIVDEPSYFKNLEATLRETLISAQRIADETVDEAQKKARQMVADAKKEADNLTETANLKVMQAKLDVENLKTAATGYRDQFKQLVDAQNKIMEETSLFKA